MIRVNTGPRAAASLTSGMDSLVVGGEVVVGAVGVVGVVGGGGSLVDVAGALLLVAVDSGGACCPRATAIALLTAGPADGIIVTSLVVSTALIGVDGSADRVRQP